MRIDNRNLSPNGLAKAQRLGLLSAPDDEPGAREIRLQTSLMKFGKPKLRRTQNGEFECFTHGAYALGPTEDAAFVAWIGTADLRAERAPKEIVNHHRTSDVFAHATRYVDKKNGIVDFSGCA